MRHSRGFVVAGVVASLAFRCTAQTPAGTELPAKVAEIRRAVGLHEEAGGLRGAGPDYKVRFSAAGIEFTPMLGLRAPHNLPVAFELQAVGRGQRLVPVPPATPEPAGTIVRYERGCCSEVYALRTDGLKQSFVFAALPAGEGDLRVRGRIRSELAPHVRGDDAVAFTAPDVGGVLLQGVLGIDADGRRAAGSLRLDGESVEFVLPAAFVDRAALPLELDPLLGTTVTVATGADDHNPDVAYDSTTNRWLVVWEDHFSSIDTDIYGRRLDASGNPVGLLIGIEDHVPSFPTQPKVANVNVRNAFVVVWEEAGSIRARGVSADTGTTTPYATVGAGPGLRTPDVGGEATVGDQAAICVYADAGGRIVATRIDYPPSSPLGIGLAVVVDSPAFSLLPNSRPAISKSGGTPGRFLIAWEHPNLQPQTTSLRCRVLDRSLALGPLLDLGTYVNPDVDGDGSRWVVAFEQRESTSLGAPSDIYARSVELQGGVPTATSNAVAVANTAGRDEHDPSVCWLGESCLVAYGDADGAGYGAVVRSIDSLFCVSCEGMFGLEIGPTSADAVLMASKVSGGGTANEAAIVWHSTLAVGNSEIKLQRFQPRDGTVADLAGGCSGGGTARATCAHQGHSGFRIRLHEARAAVSSLLVLGFQMRGLPCGSCMLLPDPFTGIVVATGTTSALGGANLPLAIPNSAGVVGNALLAQWLVGGGSNCFGGFDLSNTIRITIE